MPFTTILTAGLWEIQSTSVSQTNSLTQQFVQSCRPRSWARVLFSTNSANSHAPVRPPRRRFSAPVWWLCARSRPDGRARIIHACMDAHAHAQGHRARSPALGCVLSRAGVCALALARTLTVLTDSDSWSFLWLFPTFCVYHVAVRDLLRW